mmetsp:Transcript_22647/g.52581  ORF Transcript_22647/g.52581 Transcript_22647/m.52581 type:complete len:218 (-) Transcript_22647:146-799(-)
MHLTRPLCAPSAPSSAHPTTPFGLRCTPSCRASPSPPPPKSDIEALSAPARALGVGVLEHKLCLDRVLHEIHRAAHQEHYSLWVNEHPHPVTLHHVVELGRLVHVVHRVAQPVATPCAYPQADPKGVGVLALHKLPDPAHSVVRHLEHIPLLPRSPLLHRRRGGLGIADTVLRGSSSRRLPAVISRRGGEGQRGAAAGHACCRGTGSPGPKDARNGT